MNRRFVITNIELQMDTNKKEKSIMLLASHYASWEWLLALIKSKLSRRRRHIKIKQQLF
jgi:hypothetical protein